MQEQLKMTKEKVELNQHEFFGIQTSQEFNKKYMTTYGSHNKTSEALRIEGMYFWVSGVHLSGGNQLQRNQLPTEVVVVIEDNGQPALYTLTKQGKSSKKVSLRDNAGNGLNICETRRQAQYMYNKDLEAAVLTMNSRIRELQAVKDRLFTLELELDNQ